MPSRHEKRWAQALNDLMRLRPWEFRREAQRIRLGGDRYRGLSHDDSRDLIDRVERIWKIVNEPEPINGKLWLVAVATVVAVAAMTVLCLLLPEFLDAVQGGLPSTKPQYRQ